MCVPIIAGGEILGALTFVGAESGRRYDAEDLAFAESLAARAASAISNARLFREAVRYKRVLDATLDAVVMFDPRHAAHCLCRTAARSTSSATARRSCSTRTPRC